MIKIVIIEDEIPSRNKLKRFIEDLKIQTEIIAEIDTVAKGITFLEINNVDIIFSDIELLDGNAFEIYQKVSINCPIIFTTAYDQFWMNAFESNGIAYLLKPFSQDRFQAAWEKFLRFRNSADDRDLLLTNLSKLINQNVIDSTYKKRFTINIHKGIYFIKIENIAFFEANQGVVFAFDNIGKKHLLSESTLREIEEQINPSEFFRISRSELVSKQHIEKIERYTKNTLAVKMIGHERYLKTSQSSTSAFRVWIEK